MSMLNALRTRLQEQTMSDLIRKTDAIKALYEAWGRGWIESKCEWIAEACKQTLDALPTVEPIEWIPCSERLPEKQGEYLITATYLGEPYVTTDDYFSYGWDDWDGVIAWAERPKPWEGADDETD